MAVARLEGLEIIPTGGALGAEIRGVDLSRPLTADAAAIIRQALRQHCLIYFRKQRISERNQVDFTRHFGTPVEHVRKQLDRPIKEIFLISNLKKNGQPIGAPQQRGDRFFIPTCPTCPSPGPSRPSTPSSFPRAAVEPPGGATDTLPTTLSTTVSRPACEG